uniref:bifunctional biotin--[acetyl-CoA-carboxylase] ligase/biotin operon repressor BirA n=1 Tax=Ningiella ruwaisensis TaxID=2364274 RepID=UPI0010A060BC|nr:bifunctional biotin--[acetyl-CoA-carboxylase] ligase/biotin operon repressor BirA [Ningiella ruwaisensis]
MNSSGKSKVNQLRTKIISLLSHEHFVSGEEIATQLGVTRSAVSSHVKAISGLGLDIFSVKGKGYKLAQALNMLDSSLIFKYAANSSNGLFGQQHIIVENIVSSTNDLIKASSRELSQGSVCLAEAQTKGRGRRGRTWVSPFGASIYMSMLWRFESGYQSMSGLSLLIGIGVRRALNAMGAEKSQLKWPNDVYYNGKKLAGILIEVEGKIGDLTTAIIGIGVNVALPENVKGIDQPFTDVQTVLGKRIDRNEFAGALLNELWQMLEIFQQQGLQPFLKEWHQADLFLNERISIGAGNFSTTGISRGIDSSGALLLEVDGIVKPYFGGEIHQNIAEGANSSDSGSGNNGSEFRVRQV